LTWQLVGTENEVVSEKSNWEAFFEGHAEVYDDNVFTKNTLAEVDFLIEELGLKPGAKILDVGCGTGRHSIELARRGFDVTGIDLSEAMLAKARAKAVGLNVRFIQADATKFVFDEPFDAVIGLCEGAFGLLSTTDEPVFQPLKILGNVSSSLKPGGLAVFTVLSASRHIRMHGPEAVAKGVYDPHTLVETCEVPVADGSMVKVRERAFVPTEFSLLCRVAGLEVQHIWGGTAGNWGRRGLEPDEFEFMVVAKKVREPLDLG